jgi:hypothetical protein
MLTKVMQSKNAGLSYCIILKEISTLKKECLKELMPLCTLSYALFFTDAPQSTAILRVKVCSIQNKNRLHLS